MKRKLPASYWVTVGVILFVCFGAYISIRDTAREQEQKRQSEIARSEDRAIDRVCAQSKADSAQFSDCGSAFRIYEKCEAARFRMMEHEGIDNAEGIACEHPMYQFHAREQKEIEDAMHGQH